MLELTKYSKQELETLKKAISEEQGRRESEKFSYKVGNCFFYKDTFGDRYLIKVTNHDYDNWFTCDEISIDNSKIDYYEVSYNSIYDCDDWEPLDSKVYDEILARVNAKEETINKIISEFDKQIRELCQGLK